MHGVSNERRVERRAWKGSRLTCHVWSLRLNLCSTFGRNVKRHFVVTSSSEFSAGSGTLQPFAHFHKYSQKHIIFCSENQRMDKHLFEKRQIND